MRRRKKYIFIFKIRLTGESPGIVLLYTAHSEHQLTRFIDWPESCRSCYCFIFILCCCCFFISSLACIKSVVLFVCIFCIGLRYKFCHLACKALYSFIQLHWYGCVWFVLLVALQHVACRVASRVWCYFRKMCGDWLARPYGIGKWSKCRVCCCICDEIVAIVSVFGDCSAFCCVNDAKFW